MSEGLCPVAPRHRRELQCGGAAGCATDGTWANGTWAMEDKEATRWQSACGWREARTRRVPRVGVGPHAQ
jgi:hypothetical protein